MATTGGKDSKLYSNEAHPLIPESLFFEPNLNFAKYFDSKLGLEPCFGSKNLNLHSNSSKEKVTYFNYFPKKILPYAKENNDLNPITFS